MDQRGAVTDQLADVIRIAQLVRKSGVLIVERDGTNAGLEEGKITFVEGRVTEATAGRMSGLAAFNWLNAWGPCRFVFVPFSSSSSAFQQSTTDGMMRSTDHLLPSVPVDVAPTRIREVNEGLSLFGRLGLTRAHRQLFLLIDGQRSVSDLVRLSAHRTEDVYKLLADLERVGLIQQ